MSKLIDKAKGSKLRGNATSNVPKKQNKEKVAKEIKAKEYPRSYRLDTEIMNMLKSTLARVNEASSKKVSEARLVKALIFLSQDIDEEKIIKALKEVW